MKIFLFKNLLSLTLLLLMNCPNLAGQDIFSGSYKGTYNGVQLPNPVVIQSLGNGKFSFEVAGEKHEGKIVGDKIVGTSSAFTISKSGKDLLLSESIYNINLVKINNTAPTPSVKSTPTKTANTKSGKVDAQLVGTWMQNVTKSSAGWSHSTVSKLYIGADGTMQESSRVIGGGDTGSFDSGYKVNLQGVISAQNGILTIHEANGQQLGAQKGGTYRFVNGFSDNNVYLILKGLDGVEIRYTKED